MNSVIAVTTLSGNKDQIILASGVNSDTVESFYKLSSIICISGPIIKKFSNNFISVGSSYISYIVGLLAI